MILEHRLVEHMKEHRLVEHMKEHMWVEHMWEQQIDIMVEHMKEQQIDMRVEHMIDEWGLQLEVVEQFIFLEQHIQLFLVVSKLGRTL